MRWVNVGGLAGPASRRSGAPPLRGSTSGFTLVELMITIAVLAILLSLAAPSFQTLMMNNRLYARVDGFFNALNYARSSALSANAGTVVCPIGAINSTTCGSDWSAGWMVVGDPAGTPTLLQSASTPAGRPVLSAVVASGTPPASVAFDARGLTGTAANFKICDSRGATSARSLQVLATGFVQVGQTPGQAVWGGNLSCP